MLYVRLAVVETPPGFPLWTRLSLFVLDTFSPYCSALNDEATLVVNPYVSLVCTGNPKTNPSPHPGPRYVLCTTVEH